MRGRTWGAAVALAAVLASACSSEPALDVDLATVEAGEVVATVAAPAQLEPQARVSVVAPASGEIVAVLVDDGDEVQAGDPLVRLTSSSVETSIAQAEAAVAAAGSVGALGAVGFDLSPLFGAVREQLEVVVPDLLTALSEQALGLEDEELRDAAVARIDEARGRYEESRSSLLSAERDAQRQANAASAAARNAAAAQREQAQIALDAARSLAEDLSVTAPRNGVVELARADGGGAAVPDLGGLTGGLGGLLGGVTGGSPDRSSGPIAAGVEVSTGQELVTIYDLSGFQLRARIDELDAVEVAEGQRATVLIDAFPDAVIDGRVTHVAISPERGETGGVVFPVTVDLLVVPEDVRLRVGLSASVEIQVERTEGELTVPTAALLRRGGQEVVFVVRDGVVHEEPVDVEVLGDERALIRGDVEAGEEVVTRGVETVADGDELGE